MTLRDRALAATKDTRDLPLVEVTWLDACSCHGWQLASDARKDKVIECKTVGRLVRKDRNVVAVVQTVHEDGKVSENWVIPRACVKRIRVLR